MIEPDSRIHRVLGHALDSTEPEAVLHHAGSGAFYSLGSTGTCIWNLLESPRTLDELCVELCKEFDVTPDVCRRHAREFLEQLLDMGLVTLSDDTSSLTSP